MDLLPLEHAYVSSFEKAWLCPICAAALPPTLEGTPKNVLIVGHMLYAKLLEIEKKVDDMANDPPLYGLWSEKYQRWYYTNKHGALFYTPYKRLAEAQRDAANRMRGEMVNIESAATGTGAYVSFERGDHWEVRDILAAPDDLLDKP
jgi:hypothetical protein